MQTEMPLPTSQRLSFRIFVTTILGLALTLATIGYTLQLSWQLEGAASAINEAGSLRMRTYKLATLMAQQANADNEKQITTEIEKFNQSLLALEHGDPQRPLFLPNGIVVKKSFDVVQSDWIMHIQPLVTVNTKEAYLQSTTAFVNKINDLVSIIELDLVKKTTWLRWCQTALIFMALTASVAVLYLLFLWIIGPVTRMQAGIVRMIKDDLSVRLPIENEDEFGVLAQSFNQMADHVQTMHRTLEERVHSKTAKLTEQNQEISTLYDIAGFLSGPHEIEELCSGFLHRIMQRVGADGGTVRILDNRNDSLHITVHEGISEKMINEEHCIKKEDCFCGTATQQGIILVRDFRQLDEQKLYRCKEEGFFSLAVFQIKTRDQILGSFSLHFNVERSITGEEQRLLETLGSNLGAAIENLRSIAKEKELAVSQERNLLAQGLHDSIAQGLNFLNLQVQMLEDSLKRNEIQEIHDIAPLLRAGVQESYEDVRELLLNFRSRIQDSNLESEMRNVMNKFERQTGVHGKIEFIGIGAPLAPEQQLQVLFILQEALSNVRKHAQAKEVSVKINNERDFSFQVIDDGIGFSQEMVKEKSEEHVGLSIMQERAERMGAKLEIVSTPNEGTNIYLQLQRQERLVA
jgi:two-component system nitrate/nitrite sensor histidine kinase NarX